MDRSARSRPTETRTAEKRAELDALYHRLNPLQLQRDLQVALDRLWQLAAPDPSRMPARDTSIAPPLGKSLPSATQALASVTPTNESTETGG